MTRKIGILTFSRALNYGSVLQASGMLKALRAIEPESQIEIIDVIKLNAIYKEIRGNLRAAGFNLAKAICNFNAYNSKLSTTKAIYGFSDEDIIEKINNLKLDVIVVGSDTVFEQKRHGYARLGVNLYNNSSSVNATKVGIAVSSSGSDVSVIDREIMSEISGFSSVSYRDAFTEKLYKSSKSVGLIHDPSIMHFDKMEMQKTDTYAVIDLPRSKSRTISLCNLNKSDLLYKSPKKFPGAVKNFNSSLSVDSWVELHRQAHHTITDRFHGTLFSLYGGTPVFLIAFDSIEKKRSIAETYKDYVFLIEPISAEHIENEIRSFQDIVATFSESHRLALEEKLQEEKFKFLETIRAQLSDA